MAYTQNSNFSLEIAKGNVTKHSLITKFGLNNDIDTGVSEDVWGNGGTYVPPTAARVHNLASSSASDTSAGVGARTVLIRGIDGSYNAASETVTLNGTSNVATVNSYWHVHLMQVITVGSSAANVGLITCTAQTDATITCIIDIGLNQSQSSIYLVPVGYKGYIMTFRARMSNSTANSYCNVDLLTQPFGGGFQLKTRVGVNNSGNSSVQNDYTSSAPFIVQAKTMIKARANSSSNNSEVAAEYDLILVQD